MDVLLDQTALVMCGVVSLPGKQEMQVRVPLGARVTIATEHRNIELERLWRLLDNVPSHLFSLVRSSL